MARVEARTVAELERELREARARLSDGERTLRTARARLQVFATRYQTIVGERVELLKKLRSGGTSEPAIAPEPRSTPRAPRADRPPGHTEFERLYRELARRVHPDLAHDAAERTIRTRMMAELNVARETFDFERARKLGDAWDLRPEDVEADPSVSQFDRLLLAIERVEARLTAVAADAIRLRESDLYKLREVVDAQERAGIDVLAETAADLDVQLAEARSRIALGYDRPGEFATAEVRSLDTGRHVTEVEPAPAMRVAPLGVGAFLAGCIAVVAASLAAGSPSPVTIITTPAAGVPPTSTAVAETTAVPLSYRVIERQQSTLGRTTTTVRIVVEGSPSPAEKMSTLAEAARREIRSQQAVVVYAYRSPNEIGGPYTVGRAYMSVDGRGWDGEGHTEDGPDKGGVVGSIVVTLGATPETQAFNAQR